MRMPQPIDPPPPPPELTLVELVDASLTSGVEVSSGAVSSLVSVGVVVLVIVRDLKYVLLLEFISTTVEGLTKLTEWVISNEVFVSVVLMDRVFDEVVGFKTH